MTPPLIGPMPAPALHVMTLNVRRPMPTWRPADRWSNRMPRLAALLKEERPSLLGTQEALPVQVAAIRNALGTRYRFVGHGRRPGPRGEGCPVFYDADRLELLHWRQVPLSDHPEQPGSTSWGSVIPRVYVAARFRDRETSAEFSALNTHLDAFSPLARLRQAQEVRRVAGTLPPPVILTGDLNATPSSAPVRALLDGGVLTDAWTAAERRLSPEWATYARYRAPRPGARIDAIAVSPDVTVDRIGINARRFGGGWPSDHLPVQAVLRLTDAAPSPGRPT